MNLRISCFIRIVLFFVQLHFLGLLIPWKDFLILLSFVSYFLSREDMIFTRPGHGVPSRVSWESQRARIFLLYSSIIRFVVPKPQQPHRTNEFYNRAMRHQSVPIIQEFLRIFQHTRIYKAVIWCARRRGYGIRIAWGFAFLQKEAVHYFLGRLKFIVYDNSPYVLLLLIEF